MERHLYREMLAQLNEKLSGKSILTLKEIAELFRVDKKTVYSWVRRTNKPLPVMPTGGRCMRVSVAALADWMCCDGRRV